MATHIQPIQLASLENPENNISESMQNSSANANTSSKIESAKVQKFSGLNSVYYLKIFERISAPGRNGIIFNIASFVGGPYWAAARGLWGLFWLGLFIDIATICWSVSDYSSASRFQGLAAFVIGRGLLALFANRLYWQAFSMWREGVPSKHKFSWARLIVILAVAFSAFMVITLKTAGFVLPEILKHFPTNTGLSRYVQTNINEAVLWMTLNWGAVFDGITASVRFVLDSIERSLIATPWPALSMLILLLAWRAGGLKVLAFSIVALLYLGVFGYWEKSISTMSLVATSVIICVIFGVPLGILCAKYPRINRIANPVMDMMQTMPSFVYLLPAIAFFSIGKPPGVLATVIFAMPPVIKLTALGIRQIPENVKEAMLAFGASPIQLLVKAELPMSISSIMTGVNQSIMMSLSMVVIAALIGAGGLGFDVLTALQQMENGAGILAGVAIVLCAMLLDRIVQGKNHKV